MGNYQLTKISPLTGNLKKLLVDGFKKDLGLMAKVKIPIKIASEANNNDHWRLKSKRHMIQKAIVRSYMKLLRLPELPATITMTRYAPRPYDDDNIRSAFKYVRDAVSEHILGEIDGKKYQAGRADNDPRLNWVYAQEKTVQEEYYITIQVEQDKPTPA